MILRRQNLHDESVTESTPRVESPEPSRPHFGSLHGQYLTIPEGLEFDGDVVSKRGLRVEGVVRGRISAGNHAVSIEPRGRVTADVRAKSVVVRGILEGSIDAEDKVEVTPRGKVTGNIRARRVVLAEGSTFNGGINRDPADARAMVAEPDVAEFDFGLADAQGAVLVPRISCDEPTKPAGAPDQQGPRSVALWTLVEAKSDH